MKKPIYLFFICICLLLFIIWYGNTTKLVNFSSSNIKNIDIYKFSVPTNAEKKIVTGKNDIKIIINDINSIKIKRKATLADSTIGGAMTFVFNKIDGTQFIISYNGGTIKTPDGSPYQFWYKIDDNSMFSKWDNLNYSAQKVSRSELPIINKNWRLYALIGSDANSIIQSTAFHNVKITILSNIAKKKQI